MSSATRKFKRKKQVEKNKAAKKTISKVADQMKTLDGKKCGFCNKVFHMSMASEWKINYKPEAGIPIVLVCDECFDNENKKKDIMEAFNRWLPM